MIIKYLNYMSDYKGQYKIGDEHLENASIPIIELYPGAYKYVTPVMLREQKETGIGYNSHLLMKDFFCYSQRCITDYPKFQIPKECKYA